MGTSMVMGHEPFNHSGPVVMTWSAPGLHWWCWPTARWSPFGRSLLCRQAPPISALWDPPRIGFLSVLGGPGERARHPLQSSPAQIYNQTGLIGNEGASFSRWSHSMWRWGAVRCPSANESKHFPSRGWSAPGSELVDCAQAHSLGPRRVAPQLHCMDRRGSTDGTPIWPLGPGTGV